MPELTMFMVCSKVEKVRFQGQDGMRITGPMLAPRISKVPTIASFDVVFGLLGVKPASSVIISTRLTTPSNRVVFESIGEHRTANPGGKLQYYVGTIGRSNIWDVEIPEEGVYTYSISCDGRLVKEMPIPIFVG